MTVVDKYNPQRCLMASYVLTVGEFRTTCAVNYFQVLPKVKNKLFLNSEKVVSNISKERMVQYFVLTCNRQSALTKLDLVGGQLALIMLLGGISSRNLDFS